ncbi:MAG: hypothetical protein ACTSRP_18400 [Candidatus Helarchaeota archaeon]
MGRKLKYLAEPGLEIVHFDNLRGKTIIIDGNFFLKYALSRYRYLGKVYTNNEGLPLAHYIFLLKFINFLIKKGIKSIFIFEDKNAAKLSKENMNRIIETIKIIEKYKVIEYVDINEINFKNSKDINEDLKLENYFNKHYSKYEKIVENFINIVRNCGLCAFFISVDMFRLSTKLISEKKAFGIITDDYNCLLFKIPVMLRKFNLDNDTLQLLIIDKLLKKYGINFDQFLDINILMGIDYFPDIKIKGFGPKHALKQIKEHGSIENMIENKYIEDFNYKKIRQFFKTKEKIEIELEFPPIDTYKLEYFFIKNGILENVAEDIEEISRTYKSLKSRQMTLDSFIGK